MGKQRSVLSLLMFSSFVKRFWLSTLLYAEMRPENVPITKVRCCNSTWQDNLNGASWKTSTQPPQGLCRQPSLGNVDRCSLISWFFFFYLKQYNLSVWCNDYQRLLTGRSVVCSTQYYTALWQQCYFLYKVL